jgi:hypothetical protein
MNNLYEVEIKFTDGTYKNDVHATDQDKAYNLALIDARMAKPGAVYTGVKLSHTVTRKIDNDDSR